MTQISKTQRQNIVLTFTGSATGLPLNWRSLARRSTVHCVITDPSPLDHAVAAVRGARRPRRPGAPRGVD